MEGQDCSFPAWSESRSAGLKLGAEFSRRVEGRCEAGLKAGAELRRRRRFQTRNANAIKFNAKMLQIVKNREKLD
jgi:predicted 2-oxoglutarate/Fe(II)-dependent dioxygenase YbiX